MTEQHTPRPWYWDRDADWPSDCHVGLFSDLIVEGKPLFKPHNGVTRGEIVLGSPDGIVRCHPRNAHLIAAAPDGYELAVRVVTYLKDIAAGTLSQSQEADLLNRAKAFLAKAEGKTLKGD